MRAGVRLAIALLVIGVSGLVKSSYGQITTAAIHGNVTDPARAVVPNADIGQIESVIQPNSFGVTAGDLQPGRATQLAAKTYF